MVSNPYSKSPELVREPIYDGRNYDLHRALAFGVSAGPVRLVEPVAPPRGVPDDFADETPVGGDPNCFGHSWLLVSEIEAYDWDQPIIKYTDLVASAVMLQSDLVANRSFHSLSWFPAVVGETTGEREISGLFYWII